MNFSNSLNPLVQNGLLEVQREKGIGISENAGKENRRMRWGKKKMEEDRRRK